MFRKQRRRERRPRARCTALAVIGAVAAFGAPAAAGPSSADRPDLPAQEPAATCNGSVNHGLVDGEGRTYAGSHADPAAIVTLWRFQDNCLELRVCDTKPDDRSVTGYAIDRVRNPDHVYAQGTKGGNGTCTTRWGNWAGNDGHLAVKACVTGGTGCHVHELFLRSRAGTGGRAGYATAGQGNDSLRVCDVLDDNAHIAGVLLRPDGTALAQLNDNYGGGCATERDPTWYDRDLRIRACVSDGDRAWDCQTRNLSYDPHIF